ncbi:hypothetical protein G6Z34_13810 [Clostridium perfringens]|uniref:Zinc-ribbon domain-containing protein n=1 Tax=Clostridium perfringens TaxID=1502 RepID=A0AAP7BWM4_CLOPF|nr:hypothetical protein [Clostridium perfringens]NGU31161.1 hypothetical protein [Clostridium perfringens]
MAKRKTHEEFIQEVKELYGNEYEILGEYKGANIKILVRHNICGHEWEVIPSNLLRGQGCPVCSGRTTKLGVNTIWDTDRWMVDLGVFEEDAKRYSKCSNKKITVKCPDCGREKKTKPYVIYDNKSIFCSCGDGKSYPEKFIFNLLEQLDLEFETEYKSRWSNDKRYDFYMKNKSCIIEAHGGQHYDKGFKSIGGRTFKEEQANDKFKRDIALKNGIKHYVELDCRNSNLEWIKNSILNSELNDLFDLSKVNWNKCVEFANKNIVKEVCDYWNNRKDGETTADVGQVFKISRTSVINYLKKGAKLRWCNYNVKEEIIKCGKKSGGYNKRKVEIFKNNQSLGIFPSCTELERQSEELFRVKLWNSAISEVCNNKKSQYKGFTFKYVEDNNSNISKIA